MTHDQPSRRRYTFPGNFRLKQRRLIRPLFERGRSDVGTVASGCVRLVYRLVDRSDAGAASPLQVGFTTGRGIKKAVDRNRIKRYMREAFRVNQHLLTDVLAGFPGKMLTLMVIFRGDAEKARHQVPQHIPTALASLVEKIQGGSIPN